MTDTLHEIPDDELKRRIVQAEHLLDCLYTEKYRRLAESRPAKPKPGFTVIPRNPERRRNDKQGG